MQYKFMGMANGTPSGETYADIPYGIGSHCRFTLSPSGQGIWKNSAYCYDVILSDVQFADDDEWGKQLVGKSMMIGPNGELVGRGGWCVWAEPNWETSIPVGITHYPQRLEITQGYGPLLPGMMLAFSLLTYREET